jgi:hypothetical protein
VRRFSILILSCAIALAGSTPTLAAVPSGAPVHGIRCEAMEGNVMHIHQHLAIFDRGRPVAIPADVGQSLFGRCLYWLHTHTPDGIIHVESPSFRTFTLGEFFDIWDQPLSRTNVAGHTPRPGESVTVWVDGHRVAGDPRKIELTQHLDITIDIGSPNARPAPFTDWQGN